MRSIVSGLLVALLLVAGCTPSFLLTPIANKNDLQEREVQGGSGFFQKKIAIIPIEGTIMNARSPGLTAHR